LIVFACVLSAVLRLMTSEGEGEVSETPAVQEMVIQLDPQMLTQTLTEGAD
jgi:hypothetical protein